MVAWFFNVFFLKLGPEVLEGPPTARALTLQSTSFPWATSTHQICLPGNPVSFSVPAHFVRVDVGTDPAHRWNGKPGLHESTPPSWKTCDHPPKPENFFFFETAFSGARVPRTEPEIMFPATAATNAHRQHLQRSRNPANRPFSW